MDRARLMGGGPCPSVFLEGSVFLEDSGVVRPGLLSPWRLAGRG